MLHNTAVSQVVHNASCYNDYTLPSRASLCMLFADSLVLSAGFSDMSEDESHFFTVVKPTLIKLPSERFDLH